MAVQRQPVEAPDVLILGGGPAGLAAAIELRHAAGLEVAVAEAGGAPAERHGESLPPDIVVALERLGCGEAFRAGGHLPCPGNLSAWGSEEPGHNDFVLNPMGPAWHIDRARFVAMLRDRAAEVGAVLHTRTRAVAVAGDEVVLEHAEAGRRAVRAAWVVDATGSRAWFARRQGAVRRRHDRMVAIVRIADIRAGTFTAQTVVESAPHGWWYCARLPGDRLVTVHLTEPEEARALARAGWARWRERLAATRLLAPRLDACRLGGERLRAVAVTSAALDRVAGDGWLAAGDAACELDPVAARGIHKALADGTDAARTIAAAFGRADPPPWRYADRVAARFEDHRATCAHLYGLERRWPDAPFWRHRGASLRAE